ncbi:MAG: hypothetical protein RR356_00415 [Bacteroidales bacterium]
MKKILFIGFLTVGILVSLTGQSDRDAFRFSQTDWQGTARFMGAGGAFGAVGGDFSSLSVNPAGIGLYKKSEAVFTPMMVSVFNNRSSYNGSSVYTNHTNYSLSNVGFVLSFPINNSLWKSIQFGYGYNRISDFNNAFRIEGMSNNSSMMDEIVNKANGNIPGNLQGDEWLAYQTWMIDSVGFKQYDSPFEKQSLNQSRSTETSGGIDEMTFSFGGNYNDKFFIGATIGVPFLKYQERGIYKEAVSGEALSGITSYTIKDNLRVKGTGINLKLGIIYQAAKFLRIGAAFHTPTYYPTLRDSYYREMTSYYDNGKNSGLFDYSNEYKYSLTTPLKAIGSVAFLIQKRAFISAEYEFTSYAMSKMYAIDYSFIEENNNIQNKYGACHKVRVGAEVYITNSFLLRAGYHYKSSPYKDKINDASSHAISGGLGFRTKRFLFDLAYIYNTSKEDYWLYGSKYVNAAQIKYNTHRIVATLGCKF